MWNNLLMCHSGDLDLFLLKSLILAFLKVESALKNQKKHFRPQNKALEPQSDHK